MKGWLLANHHSADREGGHGVSFRYDEAKDELVRDDHATLMWLTQRVKSPR